MILTIRPATKEDAEYLGVNLRPDDKREVETSTGQPADKVVPLSLSLSSECYTIRLTDSNGKIENAPAVIFGVADHTNVPDLGIVWLLATPKIHRAPISILREAAPWLDHFNKRYPAGITNIVDVRNDLHMRWLAILGFEFGNVMRVNGHDFMHTMRFNREN